MKNTKNRLEQIRIYLLIVIVLASLLSFGSVQAAPAADDPLPTETEVSIEATTEATPVVVEPTPVVVEPTPVVVEPTPVVVEPTPVIVEPTPVVVEPTPVVVEPTPVVVEPTPIVVEPTPTAILVPTEEPQPPRISWKVESGTAADNLGGAATPSISGQGTLDELRQTLFGKNNTVNLIGDQASLIIKGQVIKGEELQLTIESNPSTGAAWQISGMDATILEQAGDTYFTGGIRGRQGAAQHQVISLKAVTDGNSVVELIYRRPWEPAVKSTRFVTIEGTSLKDILNLTDPETYDSLQMSETDGMVNPPLAVSDRALPSSWDWRTYNKVSSVKAQGYCGSCWAFSAAGTTESALMKQGALEMDLSEQYLVSCNIDNYTLTCDQGGVAAYAMDYHKVNGYKKLNQSLSGAVLESAFPYAESANSAGPVQACPSDYTKSYWLQQSARDSQWVAGTWSTMPTVDQIKNAIYTYGPISVSVCSGATMQAYVGGVFSTNEAAGCGGDMSNHAVMLVGWNDADNTWIMKNSWGTGWGESGYMRIVWGTSNIGIQSNYAVASSVSGGFNSQFNGSKTPWIKPSGDPTLWKVSSTNLYTYGTANRRASVIYRTSGNEHFGTQIYTAQLKRKGCNNCANALIVRGEPGTLMSLHWWRNAYYFQYTRSGYFSVWKVVGGKYTAVKYWKTTTRIKQGSQWNILKVRASGNSLQFYINGTRVWSGTDTSFATGHAGIDMYREGSGNILYVNYATLTPTLSSATQFDVISAEQAALNAAADLQGNTGTFNMAPTPKR